MPGDALTKVPIGAFVTGIIVPREGNLAITMTEKLEDVIVIIFLPLVRIFDSLRCGLIPTCSIVLHPLWSFHEPRFAQHWYHLGVHNRHLCHLLHWQILRVFHRSTCRWFQLA